MLQALKLTLLESILLLTAVAAGAVEVISFASVGQVLAPVTGNGENGYAISDHGQPD